MTDDISDPSDIKPALCELVGDSRNPKNPRRVRDLTLGDLLDYVAGLPRDTPLTYCDDGRSDTLTGICSLAYQRAVRDPDGGLVPARRKGSGTPVLVIGDR
jgi:hypothetical protein